MSSAQTKQQFMNSPTMSAVMNINTAAADLDDTHMKQVLEANLEEKQQQLDKMQIYISKMNLELQSKVERCEYLRSIFDSKSKETIETEQTLKKEILDITERLEILKLFTKRENHSHKQHKEKNSQKLEQSELKLNQLENEQSELIESIQQIELSVKQSTEEKEVKLRAALRPFQEANKEIIQQMQLFNSRKTVCEQHRERLEHLLSQEKSQESQTKENINALQQEIQKIESEKNELKAEHFDEFEIFEKEYQEEKQLNKIINERSKIEVKASKQEKFCKKLRDDIDKLEKERVDQSRKNLEKVSKLIREQQIFPSQESQTPIVNQNLKRNLEIKKVERFLRDTEKEYQSIDLTQLICNDISLDDILKKYQIKHLQQELQNLNDQFNQEEQQRDKEIQDMLNDLSSNSKSSTNTSSKWINQKYQQALENQKAQRFIYNKKVQLLTMQIQQQQGLQIEEKQYNLENLKQQYLTKIWARMNCDQEERQNFQNILELYIDRVIQRETILAQALKDKEQMEEKFREQTQLLQEKRLQLVNNQDQLEQQQQAIKDFQRKEKVLSKNLEERQTQIEFQLFKFGEKNFDDYFSKHEELFEGVKKTYGKKVCDKMKVQQKREFIEITVTQYRRRIQELKDRQSKIEENQDQIEALTKKLKEVILRNIEKLTQDLYHLNHELKTVEFQLSATMEAKQETDREIDILTTERQLDLKKMTHQLFKQKNYDNQKVRLQSVSEEIGKKQRFVQKLKVELEDKDSTVFEKTANYKAEEAQLKIRVDNLKKAQIEIQKSIKPQLIQMEREVKDLGYQINSGRRKLESLFEKYQALIGQQQLIQKTLNEKFAYEDQQISILQPVTRQFSCDEEDQQQLSSVNVAVNSSGFQYEEEYKKMQTIIDADERIQLQPLNNQIIQEISEEYDEEDKTGLISNFSNSSAVVVNSQQQAKRLNQDRKSTVSTKKKQTQDKIDKNMQELMENLTKSEISQQSQQREEKCLELTTFNNEKLLIDLSNYPQSEKDFFNKLKTLLEGEEIYKKFSTSSSMIQKPFNPLDSSITPESKGFGKRVLRLAYDLSKFDLYKPQSSIVLQNQSNNLVDYSNQSSQQPSVSHNQNNKIQSESSILIEKLMKLVIPNVTLDIIKFQKQGALQKHFINNDYSVSKQGISQQKQLIGVKRDQEEYKEKCLQARYYPFSLVLSDKTLEFVSQDYIQFKFITEALEELLKRKNSGHLIKFAKKINIC